ncbi:MAG TPA: ABC transporter permease [Gemmatimonadaceae bacterium]|jgi:ribose/xylose/arabinose/galactoside ABC-type transport system permease subunit|nr:ABC transporter permease [Gemmatimonadaceae bacterium]
MSVRERLSWQRAADFVLILATIAEAIVFATIAPGFGSVANLINIALSIAVTGILAVGMTAVILTGGIDLSVGSLVALTGTAAAMAAAAVPRGGAAGIVALVVAIAVGAIAGMLNGSFIAYLRVQPFVATLAMLTIARGAAFILSGGRSIGNLPDSFGVLGRAVPFGIPAPVYVFAAVAMIGAFVLNRTVFGRRVYATGGNPEASWLAGVGTQRVIWLVYALNGLLAGLAGLTLASRLGAGVPNSGLQYELDVIAAVVVGGTSLAGGRGTIVGTIWGTVFIGVLTNGLNLANVDPYVQKIALGVVILIAAIGDRVAGRSTGGPGTGHGS